RFQRTEEKNHSANLRDVLVQWRTQTKTGGRSSFLTSSQPEGRTKAFSVQAESRKTHPADLEEATHRDQTTHLQCKRPAGSPCRITSNSATYIKSLSAGAHESLISKNCPSSDLSTANSFLFYS
ncbi:hypothetical protein ATANTOWER_030009, partial [Ataeniobius toweri]|nr:hypothetical protein [Ataeniobius toweri]